MSVLAMSNILPPSVYIAFGVIGTIIVLFFVIGVVLVIYKFKSIKSIILSGDDTPKKSQESKIEIPEEYDRNQRREFFEHKKELARAQAEAYRAAQERKEREVAFASFSDAQLRELRDQGDMEAERALFKRAPKDPKERREFLFPLTSEELDMEKQSLVGQSRTDLSRYSSPTAAHEPEDDPSNEGSQDDVENPNEVTEEDDKELKENVANTSKETEEMTAKVNEVLSNSVMHKLLTLDQINKIKSDVLNAQSSDSFTELIRGVTSSIPKDRVSLLPKEQERLEQYNIK